jgi:hypothetical protein
VVRDEDAGVVDQRVDAAEPGQTFGDCTLCGLRVADIAGTASTLLPESFEKLEKVLARVRRAAATWAAREQKRKTGC